MCLCIPLPFTSKRKARRSDLDNDSIYVNYASSSTESSISSSSSSSSSLGYLDPYDFASLHIPQLSACPTTSTYATRGDNDSATDIDNDTSTVAHRVSIPEHCKSSILDSARSLSDLIAFSSDSSHSSQQSEHVNSDTPTPGRGYNDVKSVLATDSGYDASLDTNAIMSQTSCAPPIHGAVNDASLVFKDEVPDQTPRMKSSNSAVKRIQSGRAEELRLALLAVIRDGCANEHNNAAQMCTTQEVKNTSQPPSTAATSLSNAGVNSKISANACKKSSANKPSPHELNMDTAHDSPNIVSKSNFSEEGRSVVHSNHTNELRKSHACCIGVLSAFEEAHLGQEEKKAIIEGGCHGLCSLKITTKVRSETYEQLDEDKESPKSLSCVKGPCEKPARFTSAMPSAIMPNGRRGSISTAARFPRRRRAAQYQQPRQPLPLVQRPPHKSDTRSSSGLVHVSQLKASTMLESCSTDAQCGISTSPPRSFESPRSKLKPNHYSRKINFGDGLQKSFSDTTTKHEHQREVERNGEMFGTVSKKKKPKSGSKFSSRFSTLFRIH